MGYERFIFWFWSISFKAVFCEHSPALCTALRGNRYLLQKAAPSGKEWICILFSQTNAKNKFSQVCACNKWVANMLIFHVDVNMKRLGIRFKNDVSMIQS